MAFALVNSTLQETGQVWGVSFDAPAAQVAAARVHLDNSIDCQPARASKIPAAAIVPRNGERVRVDLADPPHPRGTGRVWPPEAAYDHDSCGRLPLLLAWPLVDDNAEWRWSFQNETRTLSPFAALAAGVREVAPSATGSVADRGVTLVIPNHWHEQAQQSLLDALHLEGISARLLWRPVAAALFWCEQLRLGQSRPAARITPNSKLLVIYAGLECFELALLDLAERRHGGESYLVPGRRRPAPLGRLPVSSGYECILDILARSQPEGSSGREPGEWWEQLWASPWLVDLLSQSEGLRISWNAPNAKRSSGLIERHLVRNSLLGSWDDLTRWCREWSQSIRDIPVEGVLVTGPLAAAMNPDGEALVDHLQANLGCRHIPSFVEGRDVPLGVLARGAALYAARLLLNLPTYLDTLPRIQTVVTRAGEPCWIDLLKEDQQFVDGGKVWRRPENLSGLALAKDSHDLKLAVAHEDFPNVREVVAPLPRVVAEREPVSIAVAVEPAQGNARLEVVPEKADVFGRRRVVFDWKQMLELPLTRDAYIDSLPRIFPGILPRRASPSRWRLTKPLVLACTKQIAARAPIDDVVRSLKAVKELLQQKDQSFYPQDATAVGSDGEPVDDPEVLSQFVARCVERMRTNSDVLLESLIRTVAYTSTAYPPFLDALHAMLLRDGRQSGQHIVTACGWCLRDPQHIASFASCFEQKLQYMRSNVQNWWKAFSEILRYRANATRDIDNAQAERFTTWALQTFEGLRLKRRGGLLFRYVSLVIVYLLRRRAYDDAYLDPAGPLAESVKQAFRQARADVRAKRLRLIGGSVNLAEQLQLMIDYIDRRGSGQLQLDV